MERAFEALYGDNGAWAQLFQLGRGFLGTELRRVSDQPPEYRTIDRWESRAAWDAFRGQHEASYEHLDRRAQLLTEVEQLMEERDAPAADE